jgi:hypothetical protein
MAVYVDDVRHAFGNMIMCHMWADTLPELMAMADRIGVARKWIQGHAELSIGKAKSASWVHFDIALSKKAMAIRAGAVLTDQYGPVEHTARLNIATGDPVLVAHGNRRLEMIASIRARDAGRLL